MITSSQSKQPGVLLMELIEGNIQDILREEDTNVHDIHLYRIGNYWVTFEKSAYMLNTLCRNAWIFPIKIGGISSPIVMVSIEHERLETDFKKQELLKDVSLERVYKCRTIFDNSNYQLWHDKEVEEIMMAVSNGMIP